MTGSDQPRRLRVGKYIPDKLYGFAVAEDGSEVFFHLGVFQPGGPWTAPERCQQCTKECAWPTTPPAPILDELVAVTVEEESPTRGKSPRAARVERLQPPTPLVGEVESFDGGRGYGFVRGSDETVYHLHKSELLDSRIPRIGQQVMFYAGLRRDRPRACHVKVCPA